MQTLSAKDARYGFGQLIDPERVESVAVVKHGQRVVVMLSVEEHERLKSMDTPKTVQAREERE